MPLITINYGYGMDGKDIAHTIARKLDVKLYDDEQIQSIINQTEKYRSSKFHFDRQAPGFWERLRRREPQQFLDIMQAAVYEIAQNGEGVIIGHGSQMLLRDFSCAFHVQLLSNFALRVENLIKNQGIKPDVAEGLIKKYDQSRNTFFRYAFQIDFDEPSLYDLVINMSKMKKKTVANLIVDAIESEDIRSCSFDALSTMEKLSLERSIHAALLEKNIDINTLNIEVSEIGRVEITGAAISQEEKDNITDTVTNVRGVSNVDVDLFVWKYSVV
jgi:cytidylate kinase